MKICCWIGSGIDETNVSWNGSGIEEKNVAEMEAENSMKLIFYFVTNCPRRIVRDELSATNRPATNCPRRIVRDELSCDELFGNPIEEVEDFCYLYSVLSSNSSCDKEIKIRTGKANAWFRRLEKIWKNKGCSVDIKLRLYEFIVLSTLLYWAET